MTGPATNDVSHKFIRRLHFRTFKKKTRYEKKRLVSKHGEFYVGLDEISLLEKLRKYIVDGFTTFLDIKWRWALLIFCMGYVITWLGFACYYFGFGVLHGDIVGESHPENWTPCVANVYSFTTALLFSVESQHTIGYGYRAVTDKCPHIITAVFFQFIIGLGVQCLIAGLVFAKLQRAKKRSETVLFSSLACVCYFNGKLRLAIRVGNLRPSHLLEVTAMGMLVKKRTTDEGDEIPFHQEHIDFKSESESDNLNLLWPAVLYHTIDENSPLKNVCSKAVLARYSELVVVLEGVIDSTSRAFQARTSYLPEETLYGYRFKSLAPVRKFDGEYQVSYSDFNYVTHQPMLLNMESRACQTHSLSSGLDTEEELTDHSNNYSESENSKESSDESCDNDGNYMMEEDERANCVTIFTPDSVDPTVDYKVDEDIPASSKNDVQISEEILTDIKNLQKIGEKIIADNTNVEKIDIDILANKKDVEHMDESQADSKLVEHTFEDTQV